MNKTLENIVNNVANEIQDTSTAFKAIIKPYINKRYLQILKSTNWNKIVPNFTISVTSGTYKYVLPDDFGKPVSITDTTNGKELAETDLGKILANYPLELTTTGTADRYFIFDDAVMAQPTSASIVTLASSSTSDTTQTVQVRGISGSVEMSESVALNGTSNVVTTNQYTRIIGISKDGVTVGKITGTTNSAAVTVCVIPPEVTTCYFKILQLHYVPTTNFTLAAPYYMKPLPLKNDDDYPVVDVADIIEAGAIADGWRYKRQFAKASVFETQFASLLSDYIWDMENQPNRIVTFEPKTFDRDNLF